MTGPFKKKIFLQTNQDSPIFHTRGNSKTFRFDIIVFLTIHHLQAECRTYKKGFLHMLFLYVLQFYVFKYFKDEYEKSYPSSLAVNSLWSIVWNAFDNFMESRLTNLFSPIFFFRFSILFRIQYWVLCFFQKPGSKGDSFLFMNSSIYLNIKLSKTLDICESTLVGP